MNKSKLIVVWAFVVGSALLFGQESQERARARSDRQISVPQRTEGSDGNTTSPPTAPPALKAVPAAPAPQSRDWREDLAMPRTLFFPTAARRPAESVAFFTQPIPEPYRVPDPPLPWPPGPPQGSSSPQPSGGDSLELLAKKSSNPISDVWMLWSQNDASSFNGDLSAG